MNKPEPEMTYNEAVISAVKSIIDADLDLAETRAAVMALIPAEFHVSGQLPEYL